ncbi:hypothetical protein EDD28_2063 [Salana multivorans]|uniref:Peptidoglycan binding protein n=1 Tax=Salana multivorans TaxID=120377 RepID=A0A3N2DDF9_9MICO|nr:hypothetical protein [Salana multivorans]ROR97464.1 hypothetical protein EDD28_2063 [Salana multivorans]
MTSQPPAGDLEGPGGSDDAGSTDPVGSAVADPAATTTAGTDLELAKAHARTGVNKTVWVLAAVAVVALGIGLVIGRFVKSPAQIAAESKPPEAGPITVEVESRIISADVLARGDAVYDDAVAVTLETGDIGGPAVVTGAVPEVGTEVQPASVLLEVAGRPVIALPGDLPVYRTLRAGASGPDVAQLQSSLIELGLDPGTSGTYDAQTAGAVAALYARAGYPAPEPAEGAREALRAAEDGVRSAEESLAMAQATLDQASRGPKDSDRIAADNQVNAAQRALDDAWACANAPADPETGQREPCGMSVADAEDALRLAKAQRSEALAGADTSGEVSARDAARRSLDDAREALSQAQRDVLTPLPASEIVYLANLPRRVDSVEVERGSTVNGAVMTISGATLQIVANVADADAALLEVGHTAQLSSGDLTLNATIQEITKQNPNQSGGDGGSGDGSKAGRTYLVLTPDELTEEQRSALVGTNVRVTIPVSSTDGEVLAVPDAALTAGAGGEVRVEVMRPGAEQPELVVVTIGLSANGYTEIVSAQSPLDVGDLVVVGQSDGSAGASPGSSDRSEESGSGDSNGSGDSEETPAEETSEDA